jgi:predicted short-subunit dehydrogenase-like oxidoreductase (DUF2520 family)
MSIKIGFIGAGRVGTALAVKLKEAGYNIIGVSSRSEESIRRFIHHVKGTKGFKSPEALLEEVELIFVTVPDDVIGEVVASLPWKEGHKVVHASGALSLDVLEGARKKGAEVGSFHPCQAFATIDQAINNITGSVFGIEASSEGLRTLLERMALDLGGSYVFVPPEGKVFYHASAVFASNYLVALVGVALKLLDFIGIGKEEGSRLLLPLIWGTLKNIQNIGLPTCLTGPIARGDITVIKKHLEALGQKDPQVFKLYASLGLQTIPIALGKGTLSEERAKILKGLFEEALKA